MNTHVVTLQGCTTLKEEFAACIGYFDGIHMGHMELLDQTIKYATQNNIKSALITFYPDPKEIIHKLDGIRHLTTLEDRKKIAQKRGIDEFIVLDFTMTMANASVDDFISMLNHLPLKALICGFDFKFAKKGLGSVTSFTKDTSNFEVIVVNEVLFNNEKISSSSIVKLIEEGNIIQANIMLGYPYSIKGIVVHGKKKGRTIGFPTCNIGFTDEYIIPKKGVYVGEITVKGKKYSAMINVGMNPTFNLNHTVSIEAHILDFNEFIYLEKVSVCFYDRIREEKKFDSIDSLKSQLKSDVETTKNYFLDKVTI